MDTEEMDIFTHVFEELDAESISRSAAMAEIKTILRKKGFSNFAGNQLWGRPIFQKNGLSVLTTSNHWVVTPQKEVGALLQKRIKTSLENGNEVIMIALAERGMDEGKVVALEMVDGNYWIAQTNWGEEGVIEHQEDYTRGPQDFDAIMQEAFQIVPKSERVGFEEKGQLLYRRESYFGIGEDSFPDKMWYDNDLWVPQPFNMRLPSSFRKNLREAYNKAAL